MTSFYPQWESFKNARPRYVRDQQVWAELIGDQCRFRINFHLNWTLGCSSPGFESRSGSQPLWLFQVLITKSNFDKNLWTVARKRMLKENRWVKKKNGPNLLFGNFYHGPETLIAVNDRHIRQCDYRCRIIFLSTSWSFSFPQWLLLSNVLFSYL